MVDGVIFGKAGLGGGMHAILKKEQLLTTRQLLSFCIARKHRDILCAAGEETTPSAKATAVEDVSKHDGNEPAWNSKRHTTECMKA
jgi:hypothetical protein